MIKMHKQENNMKGILHKSKDGWVVCCRDFLMSHVEIPLHPDSSFVEYPDSSQEGREVEFKLEEGIKEPKGYGDYPSLCQFAKLLEPIMWQDFFKEINNDNFDGWSEEAIKGYDTCRATIIEKSKEYYPPVKIK